MNLDINFSYPLLFLLLIPAVALALIPYFRISKKYRKNRNRITSIVLHLIVMFLCITVLVGVDVKYEVYNPENEIMIVVDASYSTQEEKEAKDDYIHTILSMTNSEAYKVGIVTFGYDQQYAVPLTNDISGAYNKYVNAPEPDTRATDIAAALTYAESLLKNPETAKIVLISDGVETDESALSVIKAIASKGVSVDTVLCSTIQPEQEIQIVGAELPDYNVSLYETFDITLSLQSKLYDTSSVALKLYDNGEEAETFEFDLSSGNSTYTIEHQFTEFGLHSLSFEIASSDDEIIENNSYISYMYLLSHDSILIIEYYDGQSDALYELLKEDYNPVVVNVSDADFPSTLEELRNYDEVILNNIANKDLTDYHPGFDSVLYEYVYSVGGGLFTVGGNDPQSTENNPIAHSYDRVDMQGTLLQQMLPVQAIDYTPPLGLAIIVDVSGSMASTSGSQTKLDAARDSAISIVKDETCLTERDYCGLLTLGSDFDEVTDILPMTQQDKIIEAINTLETGGGTVFAPAIRRAGMDLLALYTSKTIQKMHVIVISDGAAFDYEDYLAEVIYYNSLGVTFSFVAIDASSTDMEKLETAAGKGGGKAYNSSAANLTFTLKDDIRTPLIKDVEYGEFIPIIDINSSYSKVIAQEDMPALYGFNGTKVKTNAELVLYGEYRVPIYAQWKYGEGMVGSFMCDLKGDWSVDFIKDEAGVTLLLSIINKLFPTEDIRTNNVNVVLREENYTTQVSIYPTRELESDESIRLQVNGLTSADAEIIVTQPIASEDYSRATIVIKDPGLYEIIVSIYKGSTVIEEHTLYKTFSYSAEYNAFNETDRAELMENLAASGNGTASTLEGADPYSVFVGFETKITKHFDPRFTLIIIALVLFLLDIAVRKFKFKWPHEIIRDYKEKRKK